MPKEMKAFIGGFIAVCGFALTLPVTNHAVMFLNPIFLSALRTVLAGFIALLILIARRQKFPARHLIKYILAGSLGVTFIFPFMIAFAMQSLPASHGGVVLGALPLATAVAGSILAKERPSGLFWISATTGSLLVIAFSLSQASGGLHWADLALILAIVGAALGYTFGAIVSKELNGSYVICWMVVFALPWSIAVTVIYLPEDITLLVTNIPRSLWWAVLYLACVSQLFAFFLWYNSLALGGIARISQLQLLQPFITIGASVVMLKEVPGLNTLAFACVVVITVAINFHSKSKHNN